MTLQQIKEIRGISNKGIYSKEIKRKLSEYVKENNLNPKDVVIICQPDFSVDDLLKEVEE